MLGKYNVKARFHGRAPVVERNEIAATERPINYRSPAKPSRVRDSEIIGSGNNSPSMIIS